MQVSKMILFSLLLCGTSAMAQNTVVAKIQTVSADKNKVLLVLNSGASLSVGQTLDASSDCEVTIQKLSTGKAMANAEMCMNKNVLTIGQDLYVQNGAAVVANPGTGSENVNQNNEHHSSPSGGYRSYEESMAADQVMHRGVAKGLALFASLQSTRATVSDDSGNYLVSDNSASSLALELGYLNIPNNSIGFIARLTAGSKISGDGWGSFSYLRPEFSGTFGFNDSFYVLLGLNGTKYSGGGFDKLNTGLGLQFGVGFKVHEHALFEIAYITSSHVINTVFDDQVTLTFGSLALSAGYLF